MAPDAPRAGIQPLRRSCQNFVQRENRMLVLLTCPWAALIQGQLVLVLHSIPFISSSYSVELQTEPKALVTLGKLTANKLQCPPPFCQGLPFIFQCYYSCPTPEFLHSELPVPRDSKHEPSVWPMPG